MVRRAESAAKVGHLAGIFNAAGVLFPSKSYARMNGGQTLLIRQLNIEHFRTPANKFLACCPLPSPLPREREPVSAAGNAGNEDVDIR